MLGYIIRKPNRIPVAVWALKTSVDDYSWRNSNDRDMIELSISRADMRTVSYPDRNPRTICGKAVSCVVSNIDIRSCAPRGVRMEVASVAARIEGLEWCFREISDEDLRCGEVIILPATMDFLSERDIAELERLFNKYTHCYMQKDASAATLCGAIFLELLCIFDGYARINIGENKRDKYISYYSSKALSIIDMRYAERITLGAVAAELGISVGYLSTVFKKAVGVSFSQKLFEKRIAAAQSLAANSTLSVSKIAEATGLGDESNLRRRFRQYTGTSIREYRSVAKEQTLYLQKPTRKPE